MQNNELSWDCIQMFFVLNAFFIYYTQSVGFGCTNMGHYSLFDYCLTFLKKLYIIKNNDFRKYS